MARAKPWITNFVWDDLFMSIDWDTMLYAFEISREHGDAGIFKTPPGVHFAIGPEKMLQFRLVYDETTGLAEVVLDITYRPEPLSLGLTDKVDEAQRWVNDANELLQQAKKRRLSNGA